MGYDKIINLITRESLNSLKNYHKVTLDDVDLWHQRHCHINSRGLSKISKRELIEDIFNKRQWCKLIEGASAPYIEVVREFYANCEHFKIDDYSITSIVRGQILELFSVIIRKLYGIPKIIDLGFFYKGKRSLSNTQMSDWFIGPKWPKWSF